ncbi:MAG: hypothetical protein M3Q97_03805 [Bacteroidota bacterium]|nr:hypothetical protein [Bacteroidota bacterium]
MGLAFACVKDTEYHGFRYLVEGNIPVQITYEVSGSQISMQVHLAGSWQVPFSGKYGDEYYIEVNKIVDSTRTNPVKITVLNDDTGALLDFQNCEELNCVLRGILRKD